MATITKRPLTVVLIGVRGSGKSTLGNVLLGLDTSDPDGFQTGTDPKSCTSNTKIMSGYWLGDSLKPVRVIDTPGYGNEAGRIDDQKKKTIRVIRSEGTVDAFLWVRDSRHPRYDEREAEYLRLLMRVFGPDLVNHLVVVLDRRTFPKSDESGQQRSDAIAEGAKEGLWTFFADGRDAVEVPMVALSPPHDEGDETEAEAFRRGASDLYETVGRFAAMAVGGIEMARSANERLKKQIGRLREMRANRFLGDETLNTAARKVEELVEQLRRSRDAQQEFFG